ncbi:MAG: hypothetical protein FWH21_07045 [Kiritimatiellaeota bacterium]|nr:hypothetical protein [Kiritimatiellota bacterium]
MHILAHIQMPEGGVLRCQMPVGQKEIRSSEVQEFGGSVSEAHSLTPHPLNALTPFQLGDDCLCELDYGQDIGRLVKITEYPPHEGLPAFRVIRKQTAEDKAQLAENAEFAQKAKQSFLLSVRYEKTPVKVLRTRFSFMRERLFIRYSAAVAVDLRRFVSQIQRDYKTQVDLWQVSVRDEAAFVGCVGICGRAACCCAWQRQFPNPSTRMAKVQDIPLNPVTANGRCGKLKCCFAFEHEQYCQAGKDLPGLGSLVRCILETQEESGIVVDRSVMCGKVTVRTRDGRTFKLLKDDVILVRAARPDEPAKGDEHEDSVGEWAEP